MDDQYLTHAELVRIWRVIACENLEWGDVDSKFEGMQPGVANIFCPFHENRHSPSARPYWDEKGIFWLYIVLENTELLLYMII